MTNNKNEQMYRALELHRVGYSYRDIAKELHVSRQTISNWIKKASDEYLAMIPEQVGFIIHDQLQDLEWSKNEARKAWEASKKEKTIEEVGDKGDKIVTQSQYGDPRLLSQYMNAIDMILKIVGGYNIDRHREELLNQLDEIKQLIKSGHVTEWQAAQMFPEFKNEVLANTISNLTEDQYEKIKHGQ